MSFFTPRGFRAFLTLAILCALPLAAQQHAQPPTQTPAQQPVTKAEQPIRVNVKVVNLFATVRTKDGKIVNTLTQNDFTLLEEGIAQQIKYFSKESDLPLTLGLLVDTSLSQRLVIGQERAASQSFLDQMLRANKDVAFVIHFDNEVELF